MDSWLILARLAGGLGTTLGLTFAGCALATVLALLAGVARLSDVKPVKWLAIGYIELARGSSAYVQLFWLFFVLPMFGLRLSAFQAAALTLGLVSGAYGAEIVRGALQAIPKGQREAAIALNLPPLRRLTGILIPQALVAAMPPMSNLYVQTLKATALASLVGLQDLTFMAQTLRSAVPGISLPVFAVLLLIYLVLALSIIGLMRFCETLMRRKFGMGGAR